MSSQIINENTLVVKLEKETKLSMCRICLVENVRMHVVADKSLQELYEKLTDIPFVTEDNRPMLACFICYAKLKQCCQLQRQCLQAEELFAQMLNESYELYPALRQRQLQWCGRFITTPIEHISIVDDCRVDKDAIKVEIPAITETQYEIEIVRLKDEPLSDTEETDITHATSDNQLSSKSHTQRQQRYYERNKEIINKRKRDKRLKLNISQTPPATPAERNRNYRERNKQIINERRRHSRQLQRYVQRVNTECNVNNKDANEQITKVTQDNREKQSSKDNIIQDIAKNSSRTLRSGRSRIAESYKQENSYQLLKKIPPQHSESNSEDDLPLMAMKFEEEEQPAKETTSKVD